VQGNLGQAYLENGQYDKAVEWLLRAVREESRFCVGWYRLGDAYFRKGDDDASAEEALAVAVAVDDPACKGLQPAWRLLGEVRLRIGRRDAAVEAFGICVGIDEQSADGEACAAALGRLQGAPAAPAAETAPPAAP